VTIRMDRHGTLSGVKAHVLAGTVRVDRWGNEKAIKEWNPSQPRVPAGNSEGGQWTDEGTVGVMTHSDFPLKLFGVRRFREGEPQPVRFSHEIYAEGFTEDRRFWLDSNIKRELAEDADLPDWQMVGGAQSACAFQSPYLTRAGTHIIEQISAEFNIKPEPSEQELLDEYGPKPKWVTKRDIRDDYRANGWSKYDRAMTDEQMRRLVRAVYKRTQAALSKAGIENLTLYRGSETGAVSNVLSSWSLDPNVASRFGKSVAVTIPASAVWALPFTGFGVPSQLEVLVLNGGEYAQKARQSQKGGPGSGHHGHAGRPGEKQATPTGSPLPSWEGQVEITPEDVADALRDWDAKAPKRFRGLLLTERPEGD
jgi:hypothetical protein